MKHITNEKKPREHYHDLKSIPQCPCLCSTFLNSTLNFMHFRNFQNEVTWLLWLKCFLWIKQKNFAFKCQGQNTLHTCSTVFVSVCRSSPTRSGIVVASTEPEAVIFRQRGRVMMMMEMMKEEVFKEIFLWPALRNLQPQWLLLGLWWYDGGRTFILIIRTVRPLRYTVWFSYS